MSRYTGPVCRQCRREGVKLFLKGERCYTEKCAVSRRQTPPGQHGAGRRKVEEYGMQLREKQKAKRIYGVHETQFKNYFEKATKREGQAGENLLQLLERRLDNVVFRMGLAESRKEARQLVRHGHFKLNGKNADIPSIIVRAGDEISLKDSSRSSEKLKELIENLPNRPAAKWLEVDRDNVRARVLALPQREDVDFPFEEHLIVELYSK